MANTILAMAIDLQTFKPRLGNVMGGLSGPAVKPIVLRQVYQCARAVRVPIIGCGGIATAEDAAEYMLAGATAVQVGTATFLAAQRHDRRHRWSRPVLRSPGIARVADLIGALQHEEADEEDLAWARPAE